MKSLITAAIFLILAPGWALSQNADHPPRGQGYVFVGAASRHMSPTVGFGGEGYFKNGLGAGMEIGAAAVTDLKNSDPDRVLGLGSANLSYHFFPRKPATKAAPFVSGGYTLFFGHNATINVPKGLTTNGFNLGGGVDIFATRHLGARFEVRYYGHGGTILHFIYPNIQQFNFVAARVAVTSGRGAPCGPPRSERKKRRALVGEGPCAPPEGGP